MTHLPSRSSEVFESVRKFGLRPRSQFPNDHPFHCGGAKAMSSNTTAPSQASAWAGPPKRCSAETKNAKFDGCAEASASTLTRICGGANSSTFIPAVPSMRPSLPGIFAWNFHAPLGWSAGTVNLSHKSDPSASVVAVRCEYVSPFGLTSRSSTGIGLGAWRRPFLRSA